MTKLMPLRTVWAGLIVLILVVVALRGFDAGEAAPVNSAMVNPFAAKAGTDDIERQAALGPDLTVTALRFEAPEGEGFMAVSFRCGLVIEPADRPAQAIVTVGTGITEALSCDGLRELELLEGPGGAPLIAALYDFRSPNATFTGPIVLSRSDGQWQLDAALMEDLDQFAPIETLSTLTQALTSL